MTTRAPTSGERGRCRACVACCSGAAAARPAPLAAALLLSLPHTNTTVAAAAAARRGAGFMSLEALVWMAQRRRATFFDLLRKAQGRRSEWEYPFAAGEWRGWAGADDREQGRFPAASECKQRGEARMSGPD